MAMGRREGERQMPLWIAGTDLPSGPGHPFYKRLNTILAKHGFDRFAEELCQPFYAEKMGRPSIPPGVYFRMLMVGYFEGIDSGSEGSPGAARIRFRSGSLWATAWMSPRRTIRAPLAHAAPDLAGDAPGGVCLDAGRAGG